MKKIFAVFPILVMLIMGNMAALIARAADNGEIFIGYNWDDDFVSLDRVGRGLDDYITYHDVDDTQLYVYFEDYYIYAERTAYDIYTYRSNFMSFDSDKVVSSVYDSVADCYTLDFGSSGIRLKYSGVSFEVLTGSSVFNNTSSPSPTIANDNTYSDSVYKLKYYPTDRKVELYRTNNTLSKTIENIKNFQSNLDEVPTFGLDLTVTFNPSLSGEIDRTINQNGVQAESNYFSMNITNNSSKNAQFMMAIVPSGSSATFCGNTDTAVGAEWSASPIFYLMYKEWVYAPKITGSINGQFKAFEGEYSQVSAWHIVNGNSTYTRNFSWSQINIQASTSYDVVVLAIPTDFSKPSIVFSQSSCDHYLDTTKGVEVYRSTFTVPNPATYDSTNTEFGNVVGSIPKGESLKADAYVDENGEVVVEDISSSGLLADRDTWEPGIIEKDYADLSFDDLSNILGQSTSFFNFLANVFLWMPSWFWGLISFGVTALVIVGIVKAIL